MKHLKFLLLAPLFFALSPYLLSCATAATHCRPDLRTVNFVDLSRYTGRWHQIAFLPNRFQRNCTIDTTADYTLREDGKIGVVNECTKPDGTRKSIDGTAKVVDPQTQAKLKVKFFWFAPAGDYWVIELGANYEYAVVGTPSRKYLWILARTPYLDARAYADILARAREQGFDVSRVQKTGEVRGSTE